MAAHASKYCDLVMKGGITSGVVYPNAVLALADEYRFKNIGGTSAGAIAAAATAAAALGDRRRHHRAPLAHPDDKVGFAGLEGVAAMLATRGFIHGLFQPAPGARNAYRLIVVLAGKAGPAAKLLALAVAVVAIAPIETLLLLALLLGLGMVIGGGPGALAALLPAMLCAYGGGAFLAMLRVARVARRNLLGLCSGMGRRRRFGTSREPALTEWLHGVLQQLSGQPLDQPLTFADLWTAGRYEGEPQTPRAITLQMITTSVSHHEPRTLPFDQAGFWFRRDEFDRLFPESVVDWLVARAGAPIRAEGVDYYRLPDKGELPILVATRMSLSFPLLISAVPLHEPRTWTRPAAEPTDAEDEDGRQAVSIERTVLESADHLAGGGRPAAAGVTAFRVCWFSDGGISSNFPIHLFDAPLPLWPTFAIDLVYPGTADDGPAPPAVFLPPSNREGWQRMYQPIARRMAARELGGFLFAIVATMQNWRDLLLSRAPGQRDRIVHVALTEREGGTNLDMPQAVLEGLSAKGAAAGEAFKAFSFDNHYWIRWRNLASALQRYTVAVADSVHREPRIPAYEKAYATARTGTPPPPSYPFRSQERRAEAERLLDRLAAQGQDWEDLGPDLTTGAPRPLPQLQITPIY